MRLVTDYEEMLAVTQHMEEGVEIYEDPFVFMIDGKVVIMGELEMWNKGTCVYIKNINSVEVRKGYGRTFIEFLLYGLEKKEIVGESIKDAVLFWYKMGAKFDQKLFEQFMNEDNDVEDDYLIPFRIST